MNYYNFEELIYNMIKNDPALRYKKERFDKDGLGSYGEDLTYDLLKTYIPGYFKLIRNLVLPIGDTATEIDILMIHEKGIFVFESKNYSGWIFGKLEDHNWTQSLKGGRKYQFYNPVKQNKTHCDAICNLTKVPKQYVMSYIVFSERCELKKVPENQMYLTIIKRNNIIGEMHKDLAVRENVFTRETVNSYYKGFEYYLNNEDLKRKQKEHVEAKKREEREKKEIMKCPKCGKDLVLTPPMYGGSPHYVCPNFMQCGYKRTASREELIDREGDNIARSLAQNLNFFMSGGKTPPPKPPKGIFPFGF